MIDRDLNVIGRVRCWGVCALGMTANPEGGGLSSASRIEGVPVNLAWDLGVSDDTSIWWWQAQPSGQLLILDHYAASGVGLEHYCDVIQQREQQRGWIHRSDYVPHDAKVKSGEQAERELKQCLASASSQYLSHWPGKWMNKLLACKGPCCLCAVHTELRDGCISTLNSIAASGTTKKCFKPSAVHDWTEPTVDWRLDRQEAKRNG